ncbi:hypothetical protein CXG81DRAFT_26329 [Caulochytrium protostelioides]|uniref:Uncharacterized protein n=1 Tax=Caulochytrium protostelioides TaxID=1555241 RepID=A0A4P9X704_9FUNG|nr:hypothetical protein CXG81DRAFT_26329 [Caulochytrium protostelioides]|eukprot:RKP00972.1 hypothetical protein CXG81DRAFT_26329 [Caulochytrium protostelioides]
MNVVTILRKKAARIRYVVHVHTALSMMGETECLVIELIAAAIFGFIGVLAFKNMAYYGEGVACAVRTALAPESAATSSWCP